MNLKTEQSRMALSTAAISAGVVLMLGTQMFPHLLTWVWAAAVMVAMVAFSLIKYFGKV